MPTPTVARSPHILVAATAASLVAIAAPAGAQERTLTVYTYGSFVSDWGPGPQLTELFEDRCDCTIDWVALDDGVALLSRLRLEGDRTDADVVLGLDMNLVAEARETGLLGQHGLDLPAFSMPVAWDDPTFVPFDWGYFAFVYDSEAIATPPDSLESLFFESDAEILIQDPRVSTPGLGLLLWTATVFGDRFEAAWESVRPRVVTVTPGWSEAYGLFLEGEAPMVLSYTTSPAYHETVEGTTRYRAAEMAEGHYLQVEVAAATAGTDSPDLARDFLAFLVSEPAQAVLPTTNWMYPVTTPTEGVPESFGNLIEPDRALLMEPAEVAAERQGLIDRWLAAMSR